MFERILWSMGLLNSRYQFAGVPTAEQPQPGLRDILEARLDNLLSILNAQLAVRESLLENIESFLSLVQVIHDNEALALQPHRDDFEPILDAISLVAGAVVLRYGTATDDSSVLGHVSQREVRDLTANIVEVHISPSISAWQSFR